MTNKVAFYESNQSNFNGENLSFDFHIAVRFKEKINSTFITVRGRNPLKSLLH
jgi:hypothetical protein